MVNIRAKFQRGRTTSIIAGSLSSFLSARPQSATLFGPIVHRQQYNLEVTMLPSPQLFKFQVPSQWRQFREHGAASFSPILVTKFNQSTFTSRAHCQLPSLHIVNFWQLPRHEQVSPRSHLQSIFPVWPVPVHSQPPAPHIRAVNAARPPINAQSTASI